MALEVERPPVFRSQRFTHANMFVADLERSVRFWTEVAGLAEVLREEALKAAFLTNGETHHDIALIQAQGTELRGRDGQVQIAATVGTEPGLNHLAFELATEADVVAGYERAREQDVVIDRCLDHMVARSIYLRDPDGNGLEFYADMTTDWDDVFEEHAGELVTTKWDPLQREADAQSHRRKTPEVLETVGAALAPRQIIGAVFAVNDLARSVEFYTQVAGLTLSARTIDGRGVLMGGPEDSAGLGLIPAGGDVRRGLYRLIFSMRDASPLSEAVQRIALAGAAAHLAGSDGEGTSLLVRDPDGTICEFRPPHQPSPGAGGAGDLRQWLALS